MRLILAAALALTACGQPDYARRSAARDNKIFYAEGQVRLRLRDPDSAVFANERVSQRSGREVVCGEVNAGNAFGGMSGPARFIVGGTVALEPEHLPEDFAYYWAALC